MKIKIVGALVLVALLIVVTLQNSAPVDLRFLFWKATVDRLLLFPALFLAGFASGAAVFWAQRKGRNSSRD